MLEFQPDRSLSKAGVRPSGQLTIHRIQRVDFQIFLKPAAAEEYHLLHLFLYLTVYVSVTASHSHHIRLCVHHAFASHSHHYPHMRLCCFSTIFLSLTVMLSQIFHQTFRAPHQCVCASSHRERSLIRLIYLTSIRGLSFWQFAPIAYHQRAGFRFANSA